MRIQLTRAASDALRDLILRNGLDPSTIKLRVAVKGGGCSGFSYAFDLTDTQRETDEAFLSEGLTIIIAPKSLLYIDGLTSAGWHRTPRVAPKSVSMDFGALPCIASERGTSAYPLHNPNPKKKICNPAPSKDLPQSRRMNSHAHSHPQRAQTQALRSELTL